MTPKFFASQAAFETWLAAHHAKATELLVGLYRAKAAHRGLGYKEALDVALAWGWIDGVRRSIDDERWSIRFTPRKPKSIWSNVNVKRVKELEAEGRMHAPGLAAFRAREAHRTGIYSFEKPAEALAPTYVKRLRADRAAWAYWEKAAPYYKRVCTHWVNGAKKEETRERRFLELLRASAAGEKIAMMTWTKKKAAKR